MAASVFGKKQYMLFHGVVCVVGCDSCEVHEAGTHAMAEVSPSGDFARFADTKKPAVLGRVGMRGRESGKSVFFFGQII